MNNKPEESLVTEIQKAARLVKRDIITAQEFVGKVLHEFAHADAVYPKCIRPLLASVPASVFAEFATAIRASASPDFQWRPFYLGPGPSEAEQVQGTQRIRAWSEAMLDSLDSQQEAAV